MAKTYYLDLTTSDFTLGGQFTHELAVALGSIQTDQIIAPFLDVQQGWYAEPSDTGITRTSTGTFTVEVEISAAQADTTMACQWHRVNAAGSVQASSGFTATQATTSTGGLVFTDTATGLGTWLSTDRLAVELQVANNKSHGGDAGPIHDLETVNAEVVTPFTAGGASAFPATHYQAMMH